ncbi:DUF1294 domain-containing protein [Pseudomonas turukhanskensis]|uniref:CSD domain-containing protein n=1 Tax=Pseudomonas turukhanskensis TaxID=1806536 RepID=A0A9W6K8C1_9PSED|nr:DUF1294 domain-containing protein [Pseudomonas turukhanskensis]GLK88823.1 hypothetical protein GCM10017655_18850 [Pseudomonas turukhanskensis]
MELRGSIKSWNDDKGFGFVTPEAGGPAVFVHISAMRGERRPQAGDEVFYIASNDENGRLRAEHMRLKGLSLDEPSIRIKPKQRAPRTAKPQKPPRQRRSPTMAMPQHLGFKLVLFALLCTTPSLGVWQLFEQHRWLWVLALYPAASVLTLGFYGYDKHRAIAGQWRTPESRLHLLELLGGWPGALLAQQLYRHKTRKLDFQLVFWGIVLAHQALWLEWLVFGGEHLRGVMR